MQKRVKKNYPLCSQKVKDQIKAQALKRYENFKPSVIVNKDERFAKVSKPLHGYVTQKDLDKLDKVAQLFIKPLTREQAMKRITKLREKQKESAALDQL